MYQRIKPLLAVAIFVCSGAFTVQAQDQKPDRIFLNGKSQPELGLVVEETMDHLIWKPKSSAGDSYMGREKLSWRKIRGIRFGEQPDLYLKARKLYRRGESLDKAVDFLDEIVKKKVVNRTFFISRARYLKADILYETASSDEKFRKALDAYTDAVEKSPDNKGLYTAVQRKIELHRKLGEFEQALEAADFLVEKDPQSKGKTYGTFLKGEIRADQGNFEKAASHYSMAITYADNSGQMGVQLRAQAKLGHMYLQLEQYSKARSAYKKILNKKEQVPESRRNEFLLAAENGLGQAIYYVDYQQDAESEDARQKNVQVLKDALLHFMKGVVWYSPPKSGSKIEFERSLYWVAKVYVELAKNASDPDQKNEYTTQARIAVSTLKKQYPENAFREQVQRLMRDL